MLGEGWAFSGSSPGVWLPQRQEARPSSSRWAGLAARAVSSPGGPSCAQVRHGRWQEGEWNCPAEIRPNPAEEVPKGASRRLWVPTPTSQPLGVNPGHPVSPKLPAWMEALSFPTAEPKSCPPPPQGGQERGPPALPAGAEPALRCLYTPFNPAPACDVGLVGGFQGEEARRGLGEVSSGVSQTLLTDVPSLGS